MRLKIFFFIPITFNNPIKAWFSNKKYFKENMRDVQIENITFLII